MNQVFKGLKFNVNQQDMFSLLVILSLLLFSNLATWEAFARITDVYFDDHQKINYEPYRYVAGGAFGSDEFRPIAVQAIQLDSTETFPASASTLSMPSMTAVPAINEKVDHGEDHSIDLSQGFPQELPSEIKKPDLALGSGNPVFFGDCETSEPGKCFSQARKSCHAGDSDDCYELARYFAHIGDEQATVIYLKKAEVFGYDNYEVVAADNLFFPFKKVDEFQKTFIRIKAKRVKSIKKEKGTVADF